MPFPKEVEALNELLKDNDKLYHVIVNKATGEIVSCGYSPLEANVSQEKHQFKNPPVEDPKKEKMKHYKVDPVSKKWKKKKVNGGLLKKLK